ncbi:hypothetical protein [Bdellovibrio bacteriovorus]|uniref:hypothetical protein n=1 Tax=Bdellovibrio bacteriovorus TaxID=959 RepID=UPI003AA8FCD0
MTKQQLDEIKQRVEAATEGPWMVTKADDFPQLYKLPLYKGCCGLENDEIKTAICYPDGRMNESNSDFIAHARTDIPALLEHIESLQGQLNTEKKHHSEAVSKLLILTSKFKELQGQLEEGREVICHYAQPNHWTGNGHGGATFNAEIIGDLNDGLWCGGGKARAFFEKYPEG